MGDHNKVLRVFLRHGGPIDLVCSQAQANGMLADYARLYPADVLLGLDGSGDASPSEATVPVIEIVSMVVCPKPEP